MASSPPPINSTKRKTTGECFVYFIGEEKHGPVKIGTARDPVGRLRQIQTHYPRNLKLLACVSGYQDLEGTLHRYFADSREHGEWFRRDPPVEAFIQAVGGPVGLDLRPVWDDAAEATAEVTPPVEDRDHKPSSQQTSKQERLPCLSRRTAWRPRPSDLSDVEHVVIGQEPESPPSPVACATASVARRTEQSSVMIEARANDQRKVIRRLRGQGASPEEIASRLNALLDARAPSGR